MDPAKHLPLPHSTTLTNSSTSNSLAESVPPALDPNETSAVHGFASFSDALRRGVMNSGTENDVTTPSSVVEPAHPETNPRVISRPSPSVLGTEPSVPIPQDTDSSPPLDDLLALCLLAKTWGESISLPLIISKTKLDWKYVKGLVEYIELGNGWILLKFSTVADKDYVWHNRPWFVKGLNLVLTAWVPFFDPYSAVISYIDQWVRISRLPWEFWEEVTLTSLLQPIGKVIRIDQNTLLRKKGRFARVCLHLDVSKPLPGTLAIPTPNCTLFIPITYEGIHEVCALCGAPEHLLDQCPSLPTPPKMEVVVEKFRAHGLNDPPAAAAHSDSSEMGGQWIKISPKKRGRPLSASNTKTAFKPPSVGIRIVEPVAQAPPRVHQNSQLSHGKGKSPLCVEEQFLHPPCLPSAAPCQAPRAAHSDPGEASSSRTQATVVLPDLDPASSALVAASPSSVLEASEVFSSPAGTPGEVLMEDDGHDDFFRQLADLDEPMASTDSMKKRKFEEGDECSSPFSP